MLFVVCVGDAVIAECTADLWALFQSQTSSPIPVSWDDISGARTWLRSMFVTVYDHNPTCLAIICPKLAYMQACRLLDFSIPCTVPNIVWKTSNSSVLAEAITDMATIPGLPDFLQPPSLTKVPKSKWQIGTISVLPKWKAPGVKWRLIINKHATPCCYLHSVVSKAIDVLLDSFPMHLWSDFMSVQDVVHMVHDFNSRSDRFAFDCGYTVAADMKDCFRHLPCPDGEVMWSALSDWWRSRNVHGVSVPAMNSGEKGQLGNCTDPGWIYCALESISAVIAHFSKTNFIHIEGFLGRELQGVPQGDALSSAFLRLWKWFREYSLGLHSAAFSNCIAFDDTRCKLLHMHGANCLLLDVSYRDDLRMFFAWNANAQFSHAMLQQWAWSQFELRFRSGTMLLDESDPAKFVGLACSWMAGKLHVRPCFPDPFAAFVYSDVDSQPLVPWCSWMLPQQRKNAVRGLLCRAYYQSSSRPSRRDAFWEALISLLYRAGYPLPFIERHARLWASNWVPRGGISKDDSLVSDVEITLLRIGRKRCQIQLLPYVGSMGGRSAEEIVSLLSTDLIACSHATYLKYSFLWSSPMMLESRRAASY